MAKSEIAVSPGYAVLDLDIVATGLLLTQSYELWSTRRYYAVLPVYV